MFFVATAHEEYRERRFPAGSVVIDPWRMIPDQPGVTVRRLGENKPAMISILVPSRSRPTEFERMASTALTRSLFPGRVEIVAWLDHDDPVLNGSGRGYPPSHSRLRFVSGGRRLLSECWNECAAAARGEILMHCGDDIVFHTDGWDQIVRDTFAASEDKILLVHGDDMSPNTDALATHGFVHRRWVEAVGYFLPPLFSSDWNDVWLTEVADMVGRRVKVPIITEHMHWSFGKADRDQTHIEREERGLRDDVVGLFKRTEQMRRKDAQKLRAVMS